MCEYCKKIINNKRILDIDNDKETYIEINWQKILGYMLYVEIEGHSRQTDITNPYFILICLLLPSKTSFKSSFALFLHI